MLTFSPRTAVGIFFALQGICFSSWGSRIANLQDALQLSDATLGLILLTLPIGSLLVTPLSGMWVARLGSQRVVTWAAWAYSASLLGIALVNAQWLLICVLICFGASGTVMNIAVNSQGVAVENHYNRSVMASFHGLWSLAGFTGASFGAMLIGAHVSCLVHYGVVFVFVCGVSWYVSPCLLKDLPQVASDTPTRRLPDVHLLKLGALALCAMICEGTMFDWSGVYFNRVVRASPAWMGLGYVAFMGTMALGRFLVDRWVGVYGWVHIVRICGALIAVGLLVSAAYPSLLVATLSFMLVGAGTSAIVPLVYGQAGKSKVLSPSMALSAVSTIGFFGFLLGPPIIGLLAEVSNLRIAFVCVAIMGLLIRYMVARFATPVVAVSTAEMPMQSPTSL